MTEPARPLRPAVKIALAAMAFASLFLYAAGVLVLRQDLLPGWSLEAQGALPAAVSYLVDGSPLGATDDNINKRFLNPDGASVQALLAAAAAGSIPRGPVVMHSLDAAGVGTNIFATAAMAVFGIKLSSLIELYLVFVGISVVAFVLRFQDKRLLVVPLYFLVVTVMLVTAFGSSAGAVHQMPVGGQRYFVVAAILPALHIFFELIDRGDAGARRRRIVNWLLLFIQAALLFAVLLVRSSAGYLLIVLFAVGLWKIWDVRNRRGELTALAAKAVAVCAACALCAGLVVAELPDYVKTGRTFGNVWHRAFVSFAWAPDWPFGNLRQVYDCTRYIPEGLNRENPDRNGHCVWWAYPPNKTRSIGEVMTGVYSAEYEKAMRQAFFYVVSHYPRQVFAFYVHTKSDLIHQVLALAWRSLDIAEVPAEFRPVPVSKALFGIAAAQGILFAAFVIMLAATDRIIVDRRLLIFPVFFVASLAPAYVAWASYWTNADTVVLFYACLALAVVLAVQLALTMMPAAAPLAAARAGGSGPKPQSPPTGA